MKRIITLLTLIISTQALALKPVDGFYFSPSESGRGITIEVQKDTLVAAFYAYDSSNIARWYLSAGAYDPATTNVYHGTWDAFDGGQCAGCPYTAPTGNPSASLGAFTLEFTSWQKATMTWAGGVTQLERFRFKYGDANSYLFGTWISTRFIGTLALGEHTMLLNDTLINDGVEYVTGSLFGSSSRVVIASLVDIDPADGENIYGVLLDSSTSFYTFYIYKANKNIASGLSYLYLKTEDPGTGYFSVASKIGEYLNTNTKASSTKQTSPIDYDEIDMQMYQRQQNNQIKGKTKAFNTKYLPMLKSMQQRLEDLSK